MMILVLGNGSTLVASPGMTAPAKAGQFSGKVVETVNAASYTYVQIDTGSKKVWAAAPQFAVKTGDTVTVAEAMPMANYHSKTLNRTFDVVYFSGSVAVNGNQPNPGNAATGSLPPGHGTMPGPMKGAAIDLSGIKRAPNGQTVAEIYAGKATLAGKPIALRGRVVKYNAQILGKNWLHVRDGSGAEGSNDLTITTAATAKVGDLVLVTGTLVANRDFGSGYKYGLIVENAQVVVE
jgi:ribosomal protein S17